MADKGLRVALFGRFYNKGKDKKTIQAQKEKLRAEAKKRNYVVIDEFWEENSFLDASLDERPELKRFLKSVWNNELNIEGLFLPKFSDLGGINRKEQVTITMCFEQNDITIITYDEIYYPEVWISGLSL